MKCLYEIEAQLDSVVKYLNKRFSQNSSEYSISLGAKSQVIRYDKETAISIWACGAIVCIGSILYFIGEDDGRWYFYGSDLGVATQSNFSIGWAESFIEAMERLTKYVKENGKPVRYKFGVDSDGEPIEGEICHYKLE